MEELLSQFYNENNNIDEYNEEIIIKLYLALLSLSNQEFNEEKQKIAQEIINDFLRKLNNLKVKIQLKRKTAEIEKLQSTIKNIYYQNVAILYPYIKDKKDFEDILNKLDAQELTKLIDDLTKIKLNFEYNEEKISNDRNNIIKKIQGSNYYIKNGKIHIPYENDEIIVTYQEFLDAMSYLLNIENYFEVYSKEESKTSHREIINNIINIIINNNINNDTIKKVIIPISINNILEIENEEIDTSDFFVENIKISDLYTLAAEKKETKLANYRNISIPNEYLLPKLKQMIKSGMYYCQNDKYIFENIENKTSDFKISITVEKLIDFILNLKKITVKTK